MSQNPDPPNDNFLAYAGQPRSSALALTSMILGLVSIPLACILLGLLTGLTAIVLGIVALVAIHKNPTRHGGKGMALTGIATGIAAFPMLLLIIIVLLPSLASTRVRPNRSFCVANLRGLAQSLVVYAADNADDYPYLGGPKIAAKPALHTGPGGLMNDMFYLVGTGSVAPKQFICKSDPAKLTASMSPASIVASPPYAPTYWTHPTGGDPNLCYSYSFAFQYSSATELAAWWKNTMDAGVPIAADMNPGNQLAPGKSTRNSLNHQGDGQNVAFADGHAEFVRTPTCGELDDHLYNVGSHQPPTAPGTSGLLYPPPAGNTQGTFDTCLQPMITNTTTYTRG